MPKAEVFSQGKDARFRMEVIEGEFVCYPSLNLAVTVAHTGFCKAHGSAWVGLDDYQAFADALRQCEQARQGRATLTGMSPDELEIVVQNSDSLGHFELGYKLGRSSPRNLRAVWPQMVTGSFELDVCFLPQIVSEFSDLMPVTGD